MTRGDSVTLNSEAIAALVDPMHEKQTGTVISVCDQIATVRWNSSGRTADYGFCWLSQSPGKVALPEVKPKFDAKLSKGWRKV